MVKPALGLFILIVGMSLVAFFWDAPIDFLDNLVGENIVIGALAFGAAMFVATVVAPVTVLPLVPLLAPVLGPGTTAMISIVSWTAGAVVAFLLARHGGRPALSRFVSLDSVDKYEKFIPEDARFFVVLILRIVIPVDILSYVLGFCCSISLRSYTLATFIGVSYFAVIFSYMGEAAVKGNMLFFIGMAVVSVCIFGLGWWYVLQQMQRRDD